MSGEARILAHLERYGSITQQEANALYGVTRLGARIYDLKGRGYKITREIVRGENRFGDKCHWARYWMEKKEGARSETRQ